MTSNDQSVPVYEYAGFKYNILAMAGDRYWAIPLPGQHPAAARDKHCRAAVESWLADGKPMGGSNG